MKAYIIIDNGVVITTGFINISDVYRYIYNNYQRECIVNYGSELPINYDNFSMCFLPDLEGIVLELTGGISVAAIQIN